MTTTDITFQIDLISSAFERCAFLKDILIERIDAGVQKDIDSVLSSLASQTGLSILFLKNNIVNILDVLR
jgi:hypothetical protein